MKNFTIIFSVFFLLLACKREKMWFNDTTIEGILMDSTTLKSIEDLEIVLERSKTKNTFLGSTSKSTIIKSKFTNENGEFKIKFNRVEKYRYTLYFKVNEKYNINNFTDQYHYSYINNIRHSSLGYKIDSILKYGKPTIYLHKR